MTHFLIKYDRTSGQLLDLREFAEQDRESALRQQLALELAEREHPNIEVVVLAATSLDQVKATHSRYFETLSGLASTTRADVENLIAQLGSETLKAIATRAASEPSMTGNSQGALDELALLTARPRLKGIFPKLEGGPPGGPGSRALDLHRTLDALRRYFGIAGA